MKRLILLSGLLLAFAGGLRAQLPPVNPGWQLNWTPGSICAGDTVCFNMVATNNPPPGGFWMNSYGMVNITGMNVFTLMPTTQYCVVFPSPGLYNIRLVVYTSPNYDTLNYSVMVGQVCPGIDIISGQVYEDLNGNGSRDTLEPASPYRLVQLNPGGLITSTNASGNYAFSVNAGNYTVSVIPPTYYSVTDPVSNSYAVVTAGGSAVFGGNDFGIHQIPGINDLQVWMYGGPPVPGFDRNYYVNIHNAGTSTLSGSVDFQHDALMTYVSSGAASATYNAGTRTASWNYSNLAPGQSQYQWVTLHCPSNAVLGTPVTHYVTGNPLPGDTVPADNRDTLTRLVASSFDPNDKIAYHDENLSDTAIVPGTRLDYRIRFQNTGTAPAVNITVQDTLDADLDLSTLQVQGSSHPMTWHLTQERILTFSFMNIMLPDSGADEAGSHGQVLYSVNAKTGLSDGTQIPNTASIYFDFNAPVQTNTHMNEIRMPVIAVDKGFEGWVKVFPNPAKEGATFMLGGVEGKVNFSLFDLQGKEVRRMTEQDASGFRFDRNDLESGMYLWKISTSNGKTVSGKMLLY